MRMDGVPIETAFGAAWCTFGGCIVACRSGMVTAWCEHCGLVVATW